MIISFLLYFSMYPGLLEIRTQTWHPRRRISALVYASLMVQLHNEISSTHDTASNFLLINFNIITRNYCLNKTTLILVVAFLLSVSIYFLRYTGNETKPFVRLWFNFIPCVSKKTEVVYPYR